MGVGLTALPHRHPGESRDPFASRYQQEPMRSPQWIPTSAGMTAKGVFALLSKRWG
jgi:hypothetical protein